MSVYPLMESIFGSNLYSLNRFVKLFFILYNNSLLYYILLYNNVLLDSITLTYTSIYSQDFIYVDVLQVEVPSTQYLVKTKNPEDEPA